MSNQTTLTEFLLLGFSDVRELQILHFVMFLVIYLPSQNELRKKMSNRTTLTDFLLLGSSNVRELQSFHFVMFVVFYLACLMGNLPIIAAVALNHHLHTPMYFFLVNLSILDLGSISVTIPKSMANSLMNTRLISYPGCVTQVFLFFLFTAADLALLTIMAYDQHIAICQPLHYERVMNRRACVQMAASAWITGIVYSALHTGNTFRLPFCQSNVINQFCEIPQLLKLVCSGSYLSEVGLLAFSVFLCLNCFVFIIVSYVQIFKTVLRIPSEQCRNKAFFTCLPHLTVVSLFLCTGFFAYLKPISSSASGLDLMMGVLYSLVPPVMNPIIYSMRNEETKAALKKLFVWRLFTKT
ncbi:olfactory receptor 14A16-like [Mauremys mutica]|uniref:olfactory receptor 14A16-like n=1 Tax=Mauremys mutica TaxID=74926 RepID=UPI001D16ADCE|nr:olfactory receptor 14A16-like [Mauremys mutica]